MKYSFLILLIPFSFATMYGMAAKENIPLEEIKVKLSKPEYDKSFNDYTIHALYKGEKIGHINYGPSKNPYVPEGTWAIKSIRVDNAFLKRKVGFQLFSAAISLLRDKKVPTINIVAVPRIESLNADILTKIYLKMIEKIDPKLLAITEIRPWPSDDRFKQILIHLKKK